MKKLFKNQTFIRFLYCILSFALSLCLIGFSAVMLARFTFFNVNFFSDTLNNSEYYTDLCDEITDNFMDIGDASGLDKSFFDGFVDEILVRKDVQNYVEDFYNGKKLSVNTENFAKSLRDALAEYEKDNNIDESQLSSENINYFVDEASKIYAENIKINYFNSIQGIFLKLSPKLTYWAIILGVLSLGLACLIFFTNQWKHLGVKYLYFSCASAGLFTLIIPIAVFASGIINRISILSRSLNDLFSTCLQSVFVDMLIVAGVFVVVSVALVVIHGHLRKKVAGDNTIL